MKAYQLCFSGRKNDIFLGSIWLHLRACGHWTRRVYDLFRIKLQQEHGGSLDGYSNIHLRTSMRTRMSKTYIEELRGPNQRDINPQIDVNNNENNISSSINDNVKLKSSSVSLPHVRFQTKLTSSCQSAITLLDHSKLSSTNKSNLTERISDDTTQEEIRTSKPIIKNNNQLTIPASGDYCIRMSNTPSMYDEQQANGLNDSRTSDALGYLHMYQSHNRVQYNKLQFNDREDLQVIKKQIKNIKQNVVFDLFRF